MRTLLVCLVAGLQSAWIVGTSLIHEHHLAHDPVVRLETRPVDSRDHRRGNHVVLSYDISELSLALFQPRPENDPARGDTVFVVLEKTGDFHQPIRASLQWPALQSGQVAIRGRVEFVRRPRDPKEKRAPISHVRVRYGLERFYVSEGTANPRGQLTVDAAVSSDGRPMLKQVYLEGRPYREAMKP
jgi:uncharacterized membrane-anchored protein